MAKSIKNYPYQINTNLSHLDHYIRTQQIKHIEYPNFDYFSSMFVQMIRLCTCMSAFAFMSILYSNANILQVDSFPVIQKDTSLLFLQDSLIPDSIQSGDLLYMQDKIIESSSDSIISTKKAIKKASAELDPESYHARKAAKWGILPGGGQIYNKRWWKVPIAWGMVGAGGYFIYNSASKMKTYNRALDMRNSGQIDEFHNILTEAQIISYRNLYRRNLQLSTFGTIGLWSLTILDAVVDAHLKTYDISDNLSIKFKPKVLRVYNNSVPSLAITLYL